MKSLKITHLIFYFSALICLNISSQQISESYLKSIPENIQADVLASLQDQTGSSNIESFKVPQTSVNQLEFDLSLIKQQLEDIELQLEFESSLKKETSISIKRFGEAFFNSYQSTFLPINQPNVFSDYIVDVGDILKIQLTGQRNEIYELIVERDGTINIPEIGKELIAGLSVNNVYELVKERISKSFIGVNAMTTLSDLRDMGVLVIGNAKNPGMYTLAGGSNVLYALHVAGGVNDRGSYRSITLQRPGNPPIEIDLYKTLIFGNINQMLNLRSGDVIIVNSKLREVVISGGVGYPAIYEVLDGEKIEDVINLAGGLNPGSKNIFLETMEDGSRNRIQINQEISSNITLKTGDSIEVEDFDPKINPISVISISGEVNNPGNYTIEDGETLSSIITKAGGYTNQSYPPGGILIRESIKELEEESNLRTYNELVKVLAQALSTVVPSSRGDSGPRLDGNALALLLSELKDTKPTGRLTVEFDVSKIERDMEKDTVLKNGDSIHIPEFSKSVHVFGEVINPGTRQYDGQRNINQYVKSSGGITTYGDSSNIVVIKPNGDAFVANDGWLSWNNTDNYILPGSVIYVPRKFDKLNNLTLASAIAPIVSSLALSLASLDSIND